jgi:hypothetical protein
VALLASTMFVGVPHGERLAAADRLTADRVVAVPVGDATAVYAALER